MSFRIQTTDEINSRNYGLDFLKIVATILIVFHHYQQCAGVYFPGGINFYDASWFYWGRLVELFFMISGYVVYRYLPMIMEEKITLKDWYIKRVVRLLPLIAVSVLVFEAILYIHSPRCIGCTFCAGKSVDVWGALITSLGIQSGGAFENPMINNPTWYISVLIVMYVVFYISIVISRKLGIRVMYTWLAIVLMGFGLITYNIQLPFFNEQMGRGYSAFFMGLLLAMYVKQYGVSKHLSFSCVAVAAAFVFLCCFYPRGVASGHRYLMSYVLFPALILLTESAFAKKLFSHSIWQKWGLYSYNTFIWHVPMLLALALLGDYWNIKPYLSHYWTMAVFCILAELAGIVSHYVLEQPLDRLTKRLICKYLDNTKTAATAADNKS